MAWPETVRKSDLRIDYYRGSGPGGQHRNKTDSACRITHLPTGITAQSEEHKHQPQNKKAAFRRLAEKLIPLMKQAVETERVQQETGRIRTYHGIRNEVKDHRTSKKAPMDKVLAGNLDLLYD
jgi:protein subunit release factor A